MHTGCCTYQEKSFFLACAFIVQIACRSTVTTSGLVKTIAPSNYAITLRRLTRKVNREYEKFIT